LLACQGYKVKILLWVKGMIDNLVNRKKHLKKPLLALEIILW
jgi:hypothetical protein